MATRVCVCWPGRSSGSPGQWGWWRWRRWSRWCSGQNLSHCFLQTEPEPSTWARTHTHTHSVRTLFFPAASWPGSVLGDSLPPEQRQDAAGSFMSNQPGDVVKRLHSDRTHTQCQTVHQLFFSYFLQTKCPHKALPHWHALCRFWFLLQLVTQPERSH